MANNLVIGVIGAKGEGKTYYINHILVPAFGENVAEISAENIPFGIRMNDWFEQRLMEAYNNYKGWTIIIDDLDLWDVSVWDLFHHFITRARNIPINLIYAVKRPILVTKTLFQSTDFIVLFHTLESDLEILSKYYGKEFKNPEKGSYNPFIYPV